MADESTTGEGNDGEDGALDQILYDTYLACQGDYNPVVNDVGAELDDEFDETS